MNRESTLCGRRRPSWSRPRRAPLTVTLASLLLTSACSGQDTSGKTGSGATTVTPTGSDVKVTVRKVDAAARPLVFTASQAGSFDLWLAAADGAGPVQLTAGHDTELMAAWSPDGRRLAFVATKDIDEGPSDIYVVNADGSGLRLVTPTDDCAAGPSWSPDGRRILYARGECGGTSSAFIMDGDGGNAHPLNGDKVGWLDWSPNGRIIYETPTGAGTSALAITDEDGNDVTTLDTGALPSGTEASWSPDGHRIAYVAPTGNPSGAPEAWNEDIFVIRADGTGGRQVVHTPGNDHWPPAWSPDGNSLLYTADGAGAHPRSTQKVVDLRTLRIMPLRATVCMCALPDWRR